MNFLFLGYESTHHYLMPLYDEPTSYKMIDCVLMTVGVDNGKYLDLIINKKFPFGYYACIEGWGFEKTEHNSTHIEVEDFRCYNLHGSTEHKMEKFFK